MKKLLFLFVATSSLLISCGSDDAGSSETNAALLHGRWEAKSFNSTITIDGEPVDFDDADFDDADFEISGVIGTIFEFKSNNIFKVTSYDEFDEEWTTDEGTYVYNEATKLVTMTTVDEFDGSPEIVVMKVNLLTNSNFNFTLSETIDFDDEEEVEFSEMVITMDVNCERKN